MPLSLPGLGLRGLRLKVAMVVLVVMPSFMLFGYNNGSSGGITDLESFVKVCRLDWDICSLANILSSNSPRWIQSTWPALQSLKTLLI